MDFWYWLGGFAVLIWVVYLWEKNRPHFEMPVEDRPSMFLFRGRWYDKRFWRRVGDAVVEKHWWDPTYGLPFNDASELPEAERKKLKGWKND